MRNNWQLCSKNPPPQYTRVEIKTKDGKHYVGYRCAYTYYETIGNYIIKDPHKWRWIPEYSYLLETVKDKIKKNGMMEVGYGCSEQ